ncbi:MAG: flavodoxin family protein, partial [Treponema sp.]|nr:flavodoxin family protein [Treponema sp.]
ILNLFDYNIRDCEGCEVCITEKTCALTDEMPLVMQKILNSDGVVMSSPVYMSGVTSRFKAFADRTNMWIHKPETAGKPVMFAATSAATGLKETKRFFEQYASGLGMRKGDFISRAGRNMAKPVEEKELSRFLTLLNRDRKQYNPAMDEIVMFTVGKVLALKSTGEDRKFWEEKKWLDKSYYYPCKMNPGKKLFAKFMFKVLSKAMN